MVATGTIVCLAQQLHLPLLLLLLSILFTVSASDGPCFSEISFAEILEKAERPSCLVESGEGKSRDCSLMQHLRSLAESRNSSLDSVLSSVTVMLFAHSDFAKELATPGNPTSEIEKRTSKHLAFFGVAKCLRGQTFCKRLRANCRADTNSLVFLISGHCSQSVRCDPITSQMDNESPTHLLNFVDFIAFRLLERQMIVASELNQLQLGASTSSEFLVQSELNDVHSERLLRQNRPLAVFIAWPRSHIGYFHIFNMFIEAALALKDECDFHVVTVELSEIRDKNERPAFRRQLERHEAALAFFDSSRCASDPAWAFSCEPKTIKADRLLTRDQFTGFLLNEILKQRSLKGSAFPAFNSPNRFLKAFLDTSETFVVAVLPIDEMLTDSLLDWESLRTMASYLSATFSVAYYPLLIKNSVAAELLRSTSPGLEKDPAFDGPGFLIRLPGEVAVRCLRADEPIMKLERQIHSDDESARNFRLQVQVSQEMLVSSEVSGGTSAKMAQTGHFAGGDGSYDAGNEVKEMLDDGWVEGRVDAFVEQLKFREVYNVTGVQVVDTNDELMQKFFDSAGYDRPWLTLFVVPWSPSCKAARAVWSAVGECVRGLGGDVQLAKVDCYEANEICGRLGIYAYPTVAILREGRLVANHSGDLTIGGLCQFGGLALKPSTLVTESQAETQRLVERFLPLKSRVFVFEGAQMPRALAQVAESLHPDETFVHHRVDADAKLTARYSGVFPDVSEFDGSLDDEEAVKDFVLNGHLRLVFPCTWSYLPKALASQRPLVLLFHLNSPSDNAALLLGLRSEFGERASFSYLHLKGNAHLNDVVQKVAGLMLPALVVYANSPKGQKVTYRLPIGGLESDKVKPLASDWLEKALTHRLEGGRDLEPLGRWRPASRAYNFVDQVYGPTDSAGAKMKMKEEEEEEKGEDEDEEEKKDEKRKNDDDRRLNIRDEL